MQCLQPSTSWIAVSTSSCLYQEHLPQEATHRGIALRLKTIPLTSGISGATIALNRPQKPDIFPPAGTSEPDTVGLALPTCRAACRRHRQPFNVEHFAVRFEVRF